MTILFLRVPQSVAPSSHSWKARYFILKGHYLLYWKKRQHAVQSPNNPHCLIGMYTSIVNHIIVCYPLFSWHLSHTICLLFNPSHLNLPSFPSSFSDLEGSTIEKVSLVEGKAPQFPHCLRVTTALINHGSFLTYHFCLQEEALYRNWFNCLRRALGQPELPPSPPSHPKTTHTRSLSTGGGLGAIQRQPLQTLSSSPTSLLSTSSPSSSSSSSYYSGPSGKLGVDTVRHFQPIQIQDDLDALLNSNSEITPSTNCEYSSLLLHRCYYLFCPSLLWFFNITPCHSLTISVFHSNPILDSFDFNLRRTRPSYRILFSFSFIFRNKTRFFNTAHRLNNTSYSRDLFNSNPL
jgi:hypothetical protein